jgi:hypothetical protein
MVEGEVVPIEMTRSEKTHANSAVLDTSITQSALEEALASNLRHGGASRLSTISNAFRSRYLP